MKKVWDIDALYAYNLVLKTLVLYDSLDFQKEAHDAAIKAFIAGVPAEVVRDNFEESLTVDEFVKKCESSCKRIG